MTNKIIEKFYKKEFGIKEELLELSRKIEDRPVVKKSFSKINNMAEFNQLKVIKAFQKSKITSEDFNWYTGYSYNDKGREKIEEIFADVFRAEEALVRTQFVSGTHAISTCFFGLLRPGDEMIYASGTPYDSIHNSIGINSNGMGSLKEFGILYNEVAMKNDDIDYETLDSIISNNTKLIVLERAIGYANRKALTISKIEKFAKHIKEKYPNIITMVDNCYGEFIEERGPIEAGIDIIAGSLIKGPGGGIARSGGYVSGKKDLVEKISYRLTCPGVGGEEGAMYGQTMDILQGFYFAPIAVSNALKGAIFCGEIFKELGYQVSPEINEERSDIVETIYLGSKEKLILFCEAIQEASIIDSIYMPVPEKLPGYDDDIIMASGAFVQGSTIEVSADAPLREPYCVYYQGGLTFPHAKLAVLKAASKIL
ncbi:MAG: methionine gamma-lyase family protein [Clostridiales Family XIII bacterium]|nr:methionine gamma-lyase family protein [Clostridiales Family XIII bacterium]